MTKFRIERTEMLTRVWEVEAANEDEALENYLYEEPIPGEETHGGFPTVQIKELEKRQN